MLEYLNDIVEYIIRSFRPHRKTDIEKGHVIEYSDEEEEYADEYNIDDSYVKSTKPTRYRDTYVNINHRDLYISVHTQK